MPVHERVQGRKAARLRKNVRERSPRLPGIYGMLDSRGELIYVGKAKCLRSRLMSYFRENSREAKAGRIIERTRAILWETAPHEFAALIRELELIQRFRPRFNVQGIPGRQRYCYLAIGRSPAPSAYATRDPTGKDEHLFGPIIGMKPVKQAARRINDCFGLRDCPQRQKMQFADQLELFPIERTPGCIRYEIETCLGPCVGGCNRAQYGLRVRQAKEFLEGKRPEILDDIEKQMLDAAAAMQFERAIALREKRSDLLWIAERLGWLRDTRTRHTFVYPREASDGRMVWYLIDRGRVRGAVYAPTDRASRAAVGTMIRSVFERPHETGLLPKRQVDSVLLVAAWFRRFPQEREGLLSVAAALEKCAKSEKTTKGVHSIRSATDLE